MKISRYVRDKAYLLLLGAILWIIILLFMSAMRCKTELIIIVSVLFWSQSFAIMMVEYMRRRSFYVSLYEIMDELDQKYLVSEIMEEPQFMDGAVLYDVLRQSDKSMLEHVNDYRKREENYRDYIEMWVHEIKTPLAALKLMMSNHENELTQDLAQEVDKVEDFVEQALYYARSTTLEKYYLIKEMPLQPTVNKVIRKHAKQFIYRKIKLDAQNLDETVYCDAKWLEFILNQILSNALKYSEDQSCIHITTQKGKESVTRSIQDEGIGIALSDLPRIFDKGFTGKNGRINEKATGMGLYLCKLLCDKLNLDLRASSMEGVGTTIHITFPISTMMLLK